MYSTGIVQRICESCGAVGAEISIRDCTISVNLPADRNTEAVGGALQKGFNAALMPGWRAVVTVGAYGWQSVAALKDAVVNAEAVAKAPRLSRRAHLDFVKAEAARDAAKKQAEAMDDIRCRLEAEEERRQFAAALDGIVGEP